MTDDGQITLRPAGAEDEEFLYEVYAGTRRDEVAAWGWGEAEQEAFLRMQSAMQQRAYGMEYPGAEQRVVVRDGRAVGRMIVARAEGEWRLVDIALLPAERGAGIGRALVAGLQAEAARAGRVLRLQVDKANRARRLYERLGFVPIGESATHWHMEWRPAGQDAR